MKKSFVLYCFSPAVMLATFMIEIVFAIYTLLIHGKTRGGKIIVGLLFFLSLFQLSEFMICEDAPLMIWSRIGFVAITMLPPLGIHLVGILTKRKHLVIPSYIFGGFFILLFSFVNGAIQGGTCTGNYLVLHTSEVWGIPYTFFYLGLLIYATGEAIQGRYRASHLDKETKQILGWIITGYLAFMVPMAVVYAINESSHAGLPSIMCGFALLLAFTLALKTAPLYDRYKKLS